jgi:aspartyl-tRNA(Asn)/glutamyl-tRNA(Gln) amidotransferase subunit A
MTHAWSVAISLLQSAGHKITPISLPRTKEALSAYYVLATAEAASNFARYDGVRYGYHSPVEGYRESVLATRAHALGDEVRRRILLGNYTLSARYSTGNC